MKEHQNKEEKEFRKAAAGLLCFLVALMLILGGILHLTINKGWWLR